MRLAFALIALSACATSLAAPWQYETGEDKMTSAKTHFAVLESTNSANLAFPYSGVNRARLVIRRSPQHGLDAMFSVDKGQINCRIDSCSVLLRINEEKARRVSVNRTSDHSSKTVFLTGVNRVIADFKKAKVIRVQVEFFQNGLHVYEFDPDVPLDWPQKTNKK